MEKELSNKEILRQQLELLAEYLKNEVVDGHELAQISNSMVEVYKVLSDRKKNDFTKAEVPTIDETIKTLAERMESAFIKAAISVGDKEKSMKS